MNLLCSSTEVGASKLMSVRGEPGSGKMWVPAKFEYGIPRPRCGKIRANPERGVDDAGCNRPYAARNSQGTGGSDEPKEKLPLPHVRSLLHSALPARFLPYYTKAPAGAPSRMEDIWQPLLAVARVAGPGLEDAGAEATMVEMAAALEAPEPRAFKLVRTGGRGRGQAGAAERQPGSSSGSAWAAGKSCRMDEQKMRELLQAGGLKIKTVKIHHKPMRGYAIRDIRNAAARLRKVAAGDGAVMPETPVVTAVPDTCFERKRYQETPDSPPNSDGRREKEKKREFESGVGEYGRGLGPGSGFFAHARGSLVTAVT